jgi:hypothetical protein
MRDELDLTALSSKNQKNQFQSDKSSNHCWFFLDSQEYFGIILTEAQLCLHHFFLFQIP